MLFGLAVDDCGTLCFIGARSRGRFIPHETLKHCYPWCSKIVAGPGQFLKYLFFWCETWFPTADLQWSKRDMTWFDSSWINSIPQHRMFHCPRDCACAVWSISSAPSALDISLISSGHQFPQKLSLGMPVRSTQEKDWKRLDCPPSGHQNLITMGKSPN